MNIAKLRCEYLTDPVAIDVDRPRLSWVLESQARGQVQAAYRVLVASTPTLLAEDRGDLWDSGEVRSSRQNQVEYSGQPLQSRTRCHWKVKVWDKDGVPSAWSAPASWTTGLLTDEDWRAEWVSSTGEPESASTTLFRREFSARSPVRSLVYVTGLGLYELRINGRRVGRSALSPEWTDFRKRVQYQTYDVTDLLRDGDNAVAATVADGWWAGSVGNLPGRNHYGRGHYLLMQLEIELADGRTQTVVSDGTWKTTDRGPIVSADIYFGEKYDARLEQNGWDAAGFDDSHWKPVGGVRPGSPKLSSQPSQPIRVTQEVRPIAVTEPENGVFVFDLGQNIAGWVRAKLRGPTGTTVRFRHGEMTYPDGTIDLRSTITPNISVDTYSFKGTGEEVFEPRFTRHGFRYVEVSGLGYTPELDCLVGCVAHTDAPFVGSFECSDPQLTQLWRAILWTQRSNIWGFPTDCPQRRERLGYGGDINAFGQTACLGMDLAAFFTKWVRDIRDAQDDDGRFASIIPCIHENYYSQPYWSDIGVSAPWLVYRNYGDRRMLEEQFDAARRWVDWFRAHPFEVADRPPGALYGEWLDHTMRHGWLQFIHQEPVPPRFFALACLVESARILSETAGALGKTQEAAECSAIAQETRDAILRDFVQPDGRFKAESQGVYALALGFRLLPEDLIPMARQRLFEQIRDNDWLLTTGFVATPLVMQELAEMGRVDVAYRLLNEHRPPSWRYMLDHGATTIWEDWNAIEPHEDGGWLHSLNHFMFGAVGEWMFRHIAGISPDVAHPGYQHMTVHPKPGGGLTWAKARYESIRGPVETAWKIEGHRFRLEVTVPANCTATVCLPASEAESVTEGGVPAGSQVGVVFLRFCDGLSVYDVASGSYSFESFLSEEMIPQ